MPRFQRDDATSATIGVKSGKKADKETIYIFRCDESGLYAFTTDREAACCHHRYTRGSIGALSKRSR